MLIVRARMGERRMERVEASRAFYSAASTSASKSIALGISVINTSSSFSQFLDNHPQTLCT